MRISCYIRSIVLFVLRYQRQSILIFFFISTAVLRAQKMPVPINTQVTLFSKILTFDRNLRSRAGKEINIGIVYQKNFRTSFDAQDRFITAMAENQIKEIDGISVHCLPVELNNVIDLTKIIQENNIDILYITPMRSFDLEKIIDHTKASQTLTITGVPEYVEAGLAVGIGLKNDKPMIIINLTTSKAEGADFSSQLLKLAKVLQ
jgi:hypothetical protein